VTEQGRTNRAASAASGLSVRNKPVGFSRQWFSFFKGNRGLTLPPDSDPTMVGSAAALAFQNEISDSDSDQVNANMAKQIPEMMSEGQRHARVHSSIWGDQSRRMGPARSRDLIVRRGCPGGCGRSPLLGREHSQRAHHIVIRKENGWCPGPARSAPDPDRVAWSSLHQNNPLP
jgi:hypothetical protein